MSDTLPNGWTSATLGDLADYINGAAFKPTDWTPDGKPIIRIQNLTDASKPLNRTHRQLDPRLLIQPGDLLFSWSATLDAFIWDREPAWLNQHIFKVVPRAGVVEARYLYFLLKSEVATLVSSEHLHGSTMRHINRGPFLAHKVGLPPLREQRRIVARIEALFVRTRRARADLERVAPLARRHRDRCRAAALSGDLTAGWRRTAEIQEPAAEMLKRISRLYQREMRRPAVAPEYTPNIDLPSSWTLASVDELARAIDYGTSAQTNDDHSGVPVLRMGNIVEGILDFTKLKFLPADHREFPDLLLQPGDVLFNRTNSPELVGKTATYQGELAPCSFASYLIRLRVFGLRPELLSTFINSPFGREWVATVVSQQVGQANVNGTKLRALGVPVPPEAEQAEIADRLMAALQSSTRADKEADRALALLDRLEQSILTRAFRGELVPQDPADEPVVFEARSERPIRGRDAPPRSVAFAGPASPGAARRQRAHASTGSPAEVAGKQHDLFAQQQSASVPITSGELSIMPVGRAAVEEADLAFEVRTLFSDGRQRPREDAIRELARALGYQRVGSNIRERMNSALLAAARRGIIVNSADGLALAARSIGDFERPMLERQFLASLGGRAWKDQDEAILDFARWLGFARTGHVITETTELVIRALIRQGKLERDRRLIRRAS